MLKFLRKTIDRSYEEFVKANVEEENVQGTVDLTNELLGSDYYVRVDPYTRIRTVRSRSTDRIYYEGAAVCNPPKLRSYLTQQSSRYYEMINNFGNRGEHCSDIFDHYWPMAVAALREDVGEFDEELAYSVALSAFFAAYVAGVSDGVSDAIA